VEKADRQLSNKKCEPLPTSLTPHTLRRTLASIMFAGGEAPPDVMAQLGHTDPTVTLRFFAKVMDRRDGEPERLRALVQADIGTQKDSTGDEAASDTAAENTRKPVESGLEGP
jgi:hypothetical protein